MALTPGFQLPFGIQPLNPIPVDSWSGPYEGATLNEAIATANAAIPYAVRFQGMEVRLIVNAVATKCWYKYGLANTDLIQFSEGGGSSYIPPADATFTSSVSAPALSGVFYGDASNLRNLPVATNTFVGGVKQGANITIDTDGTISGVNPYYLSAASVNGLGGVKIDGVSMFIDNSGNIKSPLDVRYNTNLWQEANPVVATNWQDVSMSSNGKYRLLAAASGYIYVSDNRGSTWTAKLTDNTRAWKKVSMSSTGEKMVAVAANWQIYVSTDYGVTWTGRGSAGNYTSVAVAADGSRATVVGSGGLNGFIYITTDFINWTAATTGLGQAWTHVAMNSNGQYQLAQNNTDFKLYRSTNSGSTWADSGVSANARTALAINNAGDIQYFITNNTIARSTNYGVTWTNVNVVDGATSIALDTTGNILHITTSAGGIKKSINAANNMTDVTVNTNLSSFASNTGFTGIAGTPDAVNLIVTSSTPTVLVYPALRWTTTAIEGLSTNAVEATTVTSRLGTFTSVVSSREVRGMFYGDGRNLTGITSPAGLYLPLSGGTITGRVLAASGVTFVGATVFTSSSSLSVVHVNAVENIPALYIGQSGLGDIASFYDIDQGVEVLHVGGANGNRPNVGIKTSQPNKTLTVAGEISATEDITTSGKFRGDGSLLVGLPATYTPPADATFTSSVSAPALSGILQAKYLNTNVVTINGAVDPFFYVEPLWTNTIMEVNTNAQSVSALITEYIYQPVGTQVTIINTGTGTVFLQRHPTDTETQIITRNNYRNLVGVASVATLIKLGTNRWVACGTLTE